MGDFVFKMNDKLGQVFWCNSPNQFYWKHLQADQIVTCNPDIESAEIEPDWDFLILACDGKSSIADRLFMNEFWPVDEGIWDVLSNQEVVDFVTQRIGQAMEPEDICEELMTRWVIINLVHSKEKKCFGSVCWLTWWGETLQVPFTRLPDGRVRLW